MKYTKRGTPFWEKVDKNGPVVAHVGTPCWDWTGSRISTGYGNATVAGKHVLAHRFSWEMANGRKPAGVIRHRCDRPCCVRPDHLLEGTHADNARDARERGRHVRPPRLFGLSHPRGKLSDDDVIDIRSAAAFGATSTDLAAAYGITKGHARDVVTERVRPWR